MHAARFLDMAPSRPRPQEQQQQRNGNGAGPRAAPSVDPAAASVDGVAAPPRSPAKKVRGKKHGEEDEEDGKAKSKSKGRVQMLAASVAAS